MQIKPLLLCSAQKHVGVAFITPALYNAIQGNQTSGTHCFISSMYFIFPFWKTSWDLKVWVIPLPSLLRMCRWCPGELPPAAGYPHQLIVVEGFPCYFSCLHWASTLRVILLKSNRVKKTGLLLGSELRHSCWSLKTAECSATDFLGEKNQVSLTKVTGRGLFSPQGLSQPCTQTLWLQGLQAALPGCCEDILEQMGALWDWKNWLSFPPAPTVPAEEGVGATMALCAQEESVFQIPTTKETYCLSLSSIFETLTA